MCVSFLWYLPIVIVRYLAFFIVSANSYCTMPAFGANNDIVGDIGGSGSAEA